MTLAINKITEQLNPDKPSNITTVSPEFFTNTFIQYRNKTKGHGAIQKADCQKINDILLEGLEEYIISFGIFDKFSPAYISKIELDKYGKYNFSLQRLSGTDLIRAAYSTTTVDSSIRAGNICLCEPTEEGLKPLLSLHPLFIFIEDREEVYVLNEGEMSRMEYLCYHRGGKDAIYSPDELKEDFNARFGDIIGIDSVKIKAQPKIVETSPSFTDTLSWKKEKKRLPLIPIFGVSGFFIVLLIIAYFVFFKESNQQKTNVTSSDIQNQQTTLKQDSLKLSQQPGISKGETAKEKSTIETPADIKKQKEQSIEKISGVKTNKDLSETPPTYITDPDINAVPKGRAEDNLDYTNLKMSPNFKGLVRIKAFINENGTVDKAETTGGGIDPRFNSAAENAVKKLSFTPATKGGKKVKSIFMINVTFQGTR
jgi:TonB family protein